MIEFLLSQYINIHARGAKFIIKQLSYGSDIILPQLLLKTQKFNSYILNDAAGQAASFGLTSTVKLLLQYGAVVDREIFINAFKQGYYGIVELLASRQPVLTLTEYNDILSYATDNNRILYYLTIYSRGRDII